VTKETLAGRTSPAAAATTAAAGAAAAAARPAAELGTPAIQVTALSKAFGPTSVLRALSLDIPVGSITAVLGASGSGKTTLLRLIAGFDHADAGTIAIAGQVVDDGRRLIRPQRRGVGYVPQDAALFPHLTVAANIAFGVPRRHRGGLPELIDLVGLAGYEKRYPHQLSGGQQQRVALARALAIKPKVVLLDEPFGSLDAALREAVRADVAHILADARATAVLVTHDQDEALSLASHIALLDAGQIMAYGDPRDLYCYPPTPQIAAAIGTANILDGHVTGDRVHCALGTITAALSGAVPAEREQPCQVLLRPEQLLLHATPRAAATPAIVRQVRYHGHDTLVDLACDRDDLLLTARVTGDTTLQPGQRAWITVETPAHIWL
jgi:iron(III) transport system ATP-binding protein